MTTRQTAMEMPDVERVATFTHYVRTRFVGEDGYTEPATNADEDVYESGNPTRDPAAYIEALEACLQYATENHEAKFYYWVETWIRPA